LALERAPLQRDELVGGARPRRQHLVRVRVRDRDRARVKARG